MKDKQSIVWTHKKLVQRMAQWLKGRSMTIVISDLHTSNNETPDVIAWRNRASSVLIECKISRADFLADSKKVFRQYPDMAMGDKRYIAAPKGILTVDEIPEGWGLLEVGQYVKISKEAEYLKANKRNECVVLMSALRRLEISTAVYVVSDKDCHPEAE